MGDIEFYMIYADENSNKIQKTDLMWKEKSVENTWANGTGHTSNNLNLNPLSLTLKLGNLPTRGNGQVLGNYLSFFF